MRRSVQMRARDIAVPPLDAPARLARGAACFRDHCVQCHGGPGVAPAPMARSMQPLPGSLIDAARRWRPQEIYLITRDGIKMSGMPAWAMRLDEDELWSVVAFVDRLPALSPAAYESAIEGAGPGSVPRRRGPSSSGEYPDARRSSRAGPDRLAAVLVHGVSHGARDRRLRAAGRSAAGRPGEPELARGPARQHRGQPGALDPRPAQHRSAHRDARARRQRGARPLDGFLPARP